MDVMMSGCVLPLEVLLKPQNSLFAVSCVEKSIIGYSNLFNSIYSNLPISSIYFLHSRFAPPIFSQSSEDSDSCLRMCEHAMRWRLFGECPHSDCAWSFRYTTGWHEPPATLLSCMEPMFGTQHTGLGGTPSDRGIMLSSKL